MPAVVQPITVRELWALALPADTMLLAGEAGLGQVVEWVTLLRATFPVLGELAPGYLVLARPSLAQALDGRLTAQYLVHELCGAQAAALVVDEPPGEEAIVLAEQEGLPLLLMPPDGDLYQIEHDLLRALLDAQGLLARREAEAREHFQQVLSGGGLVAVLRDLAAATAGAASLFTDGGAVLAEADALPSGADRVSVRYPVQVAGRQVGQLVLYVSDIQSSPRVAVLARAAADTCAVELLEQLTRRQIEDELGADLTEQLLNGGTAAQSALSRLERQGYALQGGRDHLVVVAAVGRPDVSRRVIERLRDVAWSARRDGATTLQLHYRDSLLLFISYPAPLETHVVRRWLSEAVAHESEGDALGISRVVKRGADLGQALRQALGAQSLGSRIRGRQGPYCYDDLGLYRLLSDLRDRAELQRFYQETLGDLLAYDIDHGTELVHTLQVLFDGNMNVSQTARALFVHRNTLSYRLQRITEISGYDLNDAETRLALQLALKLHQLIAP
ncbi:MAG: helix-turn-helix domain-containing protein [Anaerolineales bacterium]